MSISSEIERIQSAKSDIITAIENKGVTVPAGAAIDELPELIDSIPSGGGGGVPTIFKNVIVSTANKLYPSFLQYDNDNKLISSNRELFSIMPDILFHWSQMNKIEASIKCYLSAYNASYPLCALYLRGMDENGNYLTNIAELDIYRPNQSYSARFRRAANGGGSWDSNDFSEGSGWNREMTCKVIVEKLTTSQTKFIFSAPPCKSTPQEVTVNYGLTGNDFRVCFGGYGVNAGEYDGATLNDGCIIYSKGTYIKVDDNLVFGEEE